MRKLLEVSVSKESLFANDKHLREEGTGEAYFFIFQGIFFYSDIYKYLRVNAVDGLSTRFW